MDDVLWMVVACLKLERSGTVTLQTASPTATVAESVEASWSMFCRIVSIFCKKNSLNLSSSVSAKQLLSSSP